jgi:CRP-like cAMP-binding protein
MNHFIAYLSRLTPISDAMSDFVATNFHPETLKKGSFFIREGEYAHDIAFLEDGIVRAFYTDEEGREYNKTFFEGPAIIGSYVALISKQKNRLPQQALTDCKIWRACGDSCRSLHLFTGVGGSVDLPTRIGDARRSSLQCSVGQCLSQLSILIRL